MMSLSSQRIGAHCNVTNDPSPNAEGEADMMPKFEDNRRIIRCPEVTVVDVEHTLMLKTCSVSAQSVV
jgi:hypothetical protein